MTIIVTLKYLPLVLRTYNVRNASTYPRYNCKYPTGYDGRIRTDFIYLVILRARAFHPRCSPMSHYRTPTSRKESRLSINQSKPFKFSPSIVSGKRGEGSLRSTSLFLCAFHVYLVQRRGPSLKELTNPVEKDGGRIWIMSWISHLKIWSDLLARGSIVPLAPATGIHDMIVEGRIHYTPTDARQLRPRVQVSAVHEVQTRDRNISSYWKIRLQSI